MKNRRMRLETHGTGGFTLVELSIVLVILGLLVGGVLAGQSLIDAANKRKLISFQEQTITAVHTFRDKYFALPGDMANATSFWGRSTDPVANCLAQPGTASAAGTCNGNGDGYIAYSAAQPLEANLAWHHLRLSGLIGGRQVGDENASVSAAAKGILRTPGQAGNVYSWLGGYEVTKTAVLYADSMTVGGSVVKGVGLQTAAQHPTGNWYNAAFAPPEFVSNIDTKIDDGNPVTGKFFGMPGSDPANPVSTYFTTCLSGSGSTWQYNLTETQNRCRMMWQVQ